MSKRNLFVAGFCAVSLLATGVVAKAVSFEDEVPENVKTQVMADLQMVAGIKATQKSPMHAAVFGAVDGQNYMNWFNARVNSFGYDADDHSGAIAYNDSISGWQRNHMMVTDYFVKGDLPQAARVDVLFHEARHSEANHGYWAHATCPTPFIGDDGKEVKSIFSGLPLAGQEGCDRTTIGAYGVSSTMLANIARFCDTCTDKLKADAQLYGADQINRILALKDRNAMRQDATQVAQ